jgi:hypothetical protein
LPLFLFTVVVALHQDGMCPCGEQAPSKESVQLASGGSGFSGGAAETMAVKVTEAFRA